MSSTKYYYLTEDYPAVLEGEQLLSLALHVSLDALMEDEANAGYS